MCPSFYTAAGLVAMSLIGLSVEPAPSAREIMSVNMHQWHAVACTVPRTTAKIDCNWRARP